MRSRPVAYPPDPPDTLIVMPLLAILLALLCYPLSLWRNVFPPAPPDPDKLGMVIRDPWYDFGTYPGKGSQPNYAAQDRMGALLAQMGVRWVRLELHIAGSDAYSLTQIARNDYFIREVAPRHNLRILALLGFGLIRDYDPHRLGHRSRTHDPVYGVGIDPLKRLWLDRARLIANRYGSQIAAYEIFNEPNRVAHFGDSAIPPAEIARLHTAFYTSFRHTERAAPGDQAWRDAVQIILGGLQPAGTGKRSDPGYRSDRAYLRQLYTTESFARYYEMYGRFPLDGVGVHPYPREIFRSSMGQQGKVNVKAPDALPNKNARPWPTGAERDLQLMMQRLNELRRVLREVGDGARPFWVTEIGYNVGHPWHSEATQADFVRRVFTRLAARADIKHIFWFKWEDFPPAIGPSAQQWGMVVIPYVQQDACPGRACYDPAARPVRLRPAFWVYRELAGVDASLPEPPAQVTISGPTMGTTSVPISFTATLSRRTAAQPVSYTWQVEQQNDLARQNGWHDSATFTWRRPGTYTLLVEATNASGTVITAHHITIRQPSAVSRDPSTVMSNRDP